MERFFLRTPFVCLFCATFVLIMSHCTPAEKQNNQVSMSSEATLDSLKRQISYVFAQTSGEYALAFQEIGGAQRQLLINERTSFHAASTMKTPVLVEVYKQVQEGKLTLDDPIRIKNEFYSIVDSSSFSLSLDSDSNDKLYTAIGEERPLREVIYDMIIWSSNLATNLVIELVDAKNVTQTMRDMGASDIEVLRGVEDLKAFDQGLNNTTTAYDLMRMFQHIAQGTAVSSEASEEMIRILLDQQFKTIIPAQLPENVRVAHKTGWISTARHDSGIVILPDGRRYVLVLLSKNWESDDVAVETMARVSRLIYDFFTQAQ